LTLEQIIELNGTIDMIFEMLVTDSMASDKIFKGALELHSEQNPMSFYSNWFQIKTQED
jgi:hypothetical protein